VKEIKLFNKVLQGDSTANCVDRRLYKKAFVDYQLVLSPKADTRRIAAYLMTIPSKFVTFHKDFEAVRNTPNCVLYIEQLAHYASTYGTNHTEEMYLPSQGLCNITYSGERFIDAITKEELRDKLEKLIYGNIALSADDMNDAMELVDELDFPLHTSMCANREMAIRIALHNNETPRTNDEAMRMINYIVTGNSTVIKNQDTIALYKLNVNSHFSKVKGLLNKLDMIYMAKVFNRYKPLFLAMKKSDGRMISYVNRLSKLSKRYHAPFVAPIETIFLTRKFIADTHKESGDTAYFNIVDRIGRGATVFQLEKYIRAAKKRINATTNFTIDVYNIRNGKQFIKANDEQIREYNNIDLNHLYNQVRNILTNELHYRLDYFKLPNGVKTNLNLTIPTSLKDCVGSVPYGTSIDFGKYNNIQIGIHWTDEECGQDLDLSINGDGFQVSWNTDQVAQGITHTGDMTSADPEATEMISLDKHIGKGRIIVTPYSCKPNAKFTFFIAKNGDVDTQDPVSHTHKIINTKEKGEILFMSEMRLNGEITLGYIDGDEFYFSGRETSKKRIPSRYNSSLMRGEIDHMRTFTMLDRNDNGTTVDNAKNLFEVLS
jgi:hypothetical protein